MAFDVHQQIFDENNMLLEKKSYRYREQLLKLFGRSAEWRALNADEAAPEWSSLMLDMAIDYVGVAPPQMTPGDLRKVLFELFPQKVSVPVDLCGFERSITSPGAAGGSMLYWKDRGRLIKTSAIRCI